MEEAQPLAPLFPQIAKEAAEIILEVILNLFFTCCYLNKNSKTGAFNSGVGRESREITLKNARKKIQALAQQLRLRPDHIDMVDGRLIH